ncbi:MAG TPA: DNA primase, partial [Candidatus Vogelbacteria bacterium]|nr:DNA primase [Candidatus Vogelbacteria bacterium]
MSTPVEKIKERLDIVDIIGSYIKLEKAGVNYRSRCPFHNEKTPSFFVSPSRQSYHCFGCDRGGDIISFVQEIEGLDFKGALELLADKAGINLVYKNSKEISEVAKLTKILEIALKFYQQKLKINDQAIKYLLQRGLKKETIENFSLGYAPLEWRSLTNHLIDAGFSLADAEKIGLVIKNDKRGDISFYDRFRGRLMFPLFDCNGKIVGFSGRIYDDEKNRTTEGKYINS